jgi:hypothetical protein
MIGEKGDAGQPWKRRWTSAAGKTGNGIFSPVAHEVAQYTVFFGGL